MPELVLGPVLRHAGLSDATVWVETGERCEVEVLGCSSPTFRVGDHHYALVHVTGLEPGTVREYEVKLDGAVVWPEPGSPFPPSVVRTRGEGGPVKLVFGSCRIAAPHEPPYTLGLAQDPRGLGVDALYAMAMSLRDESTDELPDALVLLGDQIYAHKPPSTPSTLSAPGATRTGPPARPSQTSRSKPACTATPGGTPPSAGSSPPFPPP